MSQHPNEKSSESLEAAQGSLPKVIHESPIPASTPVRKHDTQMNADAGVSTQPKSLVVGAPTMKTLGRYTILSELGRGGMGAVYLAEDSVLKRKVALKIPQFEPHRAEQMQARFLREAQMAAQLSHSNICHVHDIGVIDGQYVMAMEFIEGKTLAAFTKPEKLLSERQAAVLIRKVALAVEAAHQKGLIHRDLKPGNIMLPKLDHIRKVMEPKVMDFGLAKSLDARTTDLTKSGMIVGTPCYMSKEQWSGKDVQLGPQCDIYGLGIILYELLTGALPYDVEDDEPATSWFVKLVTETQIRLSQRKPDIDAALEKIVMKAIAIDPADRFASMAEFASAIDGWLKGKSSTGLSLAGTPSPSSGTESATAAAGLSIGSGLRGFPRKLLLAGGGLGAFTLLLGIIIVITNRDGSKTTVHVPDGASVIIASDEGEPAKADVAPAPAPPAADVAQDVVSLPANESPAPATEPKVPASEPEGIRTLKEALVGYSWNYVDSLYLPGGPVRFYRNGKFHDQWKWNYWVVGPRTMHVQFWDDQYDPKKSVTFHFNEDLTRFSASFDNHKVTGTRLKAVEKPR